MAANEPLVVVPANEAMAREPARTIAAETAPVTTREATGNALSAYSTVDRIKLAVAALIGLAVTLGANISPDVSTQVQNTITTAAPLVLMLYAWWQTERSKRAAITGSVATAVESQALRQGEETRAAVYSPATVAAIVAGEAPAGEPVDAVIVDPPGDRVDID